jgi:hypothetical protein
MSKQDQAAKLRSRIVILLEKRRYANDPQSVMKEISELSAKVENLLAAQKANLDR